MSLQVLIPYITKTAEAWKQFIAEKYFETKEWMNEWMQWWKQ
jgi:hypothetical protein